MESHNELKPVFNRRGAQSLANISWWLLPLITLPTYINAGQTVVTPLAQLETIYDDNIRLDNIPLEAYETTASLGARSVYRTDASLLSGDFRWDNVSYQKGEGLDNRNDYKLKLRAREDYERNTWQFDVIGIKDSTAKDITIDNGADLPSDDEDIGGDVGFIRDDVTRNRYYLKPSWSYDLSEISEVGLSYKYSDLRYDDSRQHDLEDAFNHNVTVFYGVNTSEVNKVSPSIAVNHYESEDAKNYDFLIGSVSNERTYGERFTSYASIGLYYVDAEKNTISETDTGSLYELSGIYSLTSFSINVSAERTLAPGDFGNVVAKDRYMIGLIGEINPTWGYELGALYYRNRAIIKEIANSSRRYATLRTSLYWHITESVDLDFGYRFRKEKELTEADSNAIFVSVRYVNDFAM